MTANGHKLSFQQARAGSSVASRQLKTGSQAVTKTVSQLVDGYDCYVVR